MTGKERDGAMINRLIKVGALILLWTANLLLVISLWTSIIGIGIFGIIIGAVLGLPLAYLWIISDKIAFREFDKTVRPTLERLAGRRSIRSVPQLPEKVNRPSSSAAKPGPGGIDVPVRVTQTHKVVIEHQTIEPEPLHIPVDTTEAIPRQPTEWEVQRALDAEYERIKEEMISLDYDGLLAYIDHDDARVRLWVVQTLRHMDDERVTQDLTRALEDSNVVVRRAAKIALDELTLDKR
jgi:hypothetical protein